MTVGVVVIFTILLLGYLLIIGMLGWAVRHDVKEDDRLKWLL